MARITFRQGIVTHPKNTISGEQTFLRKTGDNVDLVIDVNTSSEPISVAFAHEDTDYLYTETLAVDSAWTDIVAGQDYWLYWDINLTTGHLSRGSTTLEPMYQPTQPSAAQRIDGQMWYNTNTNVFSVWQGSVWIEIVRVMAARVSNGTQFQSLSINANANEFSGTQVGIFAGQRFGRNVGSLVFNNAGRAIRSGIRRQFFTTEDKFLTGVPTGASLRIGNTVISGEAQCAIAAYQIVQYDDYNSICLANAFNQGMKLFGVVEFDVEIGETASFVTEGIIFNEAWNWEELGAEVNAPLYIDNQSKEFTLVKGIADIPPVGVVIGNKEVYFAPRLFPQLEVSDGNDAGLTAEQLAQLNSLITKVDNNTATIASQQSVLDQLTDNVEDISELAAELRTDVDDKLPLSGGTLTGPLELLDGIPPQDSHAVSKGYVDSVSGGYQTTFVATDWTDPIGTTNTRQLLIAADEHKLPIGRYYDLIMLNQVNRRILIDYSVNIDDGLITIQTAGNPFAGSLRIV